MIIGITGYKNSGKDTIADYLISKYRYHKITFAGPLKDICKTLFFLSNDQLNNRILKEQKIKQYDLSPRQILQKVGTDLFRNHFDQDFWTVHFKTRISILRDNGIHYIVCSDVRFQNELDLIHEMGGIIIRVNRFNTSSDYHESENIDGLKNIDYQINNYLSPHELFSQIDQLLQDLKKKV
jgi:hypothetical protein